MSDGEIINIISAPITKIIIIDNAEQNCYQIVPTSQQMFDFKKKTNKVKWVEHCGTRFQYPCLDWLVVARNLMLQFVVCYSRLTQDI